MVYGKMCVQQYWTPIYHFMADVEPCYDVINELWQGFLLPLLGEFGIFGRCSPIEKFHIKQQKNFPGYLNL